MFAVRFFVVNTADAITIANTTQVEIGTKQKYESNTPNKSQTHTHAYQTILRTTLTLTKHQQEILRVYDNWQM